ncbi:MAG: SDR family NAD(P)-dependent oxidoreductase [Cyanobacteria bacterium M_DeepCast_100m_m1_067]|nr:SDR family NAD(P)-dependent oxidoreductase [Cyanobacteria bacterium M_DeepCast_100m_m1_067]
MSRSYACTVAVTGASGSLGQALLRRWSRQGAQLVALTSSTRPLDLLDDAGDTISLEQVSWQIGEEHALRPLLGRVDVLVLNHGVNQQQARSRETTDLALEVNALSSWRLLELFAEVVQQRPGDGRPRAEVWINTSEAEIQPAFSPLYELSKRLLGTLVSLRALDLAGAEGPLRIRRLVLGPFRSALNPIGVMGADFVAGQVLAQARLGFNLIIVTPNPLTYVLMPLTSLGRWAYFKLLTRPGS